MTGYGKSEALFPHKKTIIEIRSVNSKQLDLTLKTAAYYRDKEPEIRQLLQAPLERGKVDVCIYVENTQSVESDLVFTQVNWDAVRYYICDYWAHAKTLQLPLNADGGVPAEVMASIMRYPDVLRPAQASQEELTEEEWTAVKNAINAALNQYLAFRKQEGESLYHMFTEKLDAIAALLAEVEPYETHRIDRIRERLMSNLEELQKKDKVEIDKNRLEAEMIYWLEKLDITEEKVRLTNHIRYFRETMAEDGAGVGKKLGFIAQEMGREINTLGSKSNQSEMQVIVVKMKDLLEQIKEQVLNVL